MKLSNLLDHHHRHQSAPGGLKDAFGDGLLVSKNRIYVRVRDEALKAGYQFSSAANSAYAALPLSQLESVLKSKTIPYAPNVAVIAELEAKIPKQTDWDDIVDGFRGTHVFHESCHAVARGFVPELASKLGNNVEHRVLAMLLEESFANTCELISIIDADDQIHRLFLELNSYVYMLNDRAGLLNAEREIGRPTLIVFLMLAYLHANFLRSMTEKDFERCFSIAAQGALDQKSKKALRALSKIAFQLNPRFREVTTRFHLKLHGIKTDVSALGSFDFLSVFEQSKAAQSFLAAAKTF